MTLEERQARIDNIITKLASNNPYISPEQVARAKNQYRNDYRPIGDIERELNEYSESIRQSGKARKTETALADQRHEVTAFAKSEIRPDQVQVQDPVDGMELELSELFDSNQPQPKDMDGRLGQVAIADSMAAQPDPTDELDAMFDTTATEETDFTTVDDLGEKHNPKVLAKMFNKEYKNPTDNKGTGESGFTSSNALLTISIFFSIMGIIVSLLVLYTS